MDGSDDEQSGDNSSSDKSIAPTSRSESQKHIIISSDDDGNFESIDDSYWEVIFEEDDAQPQTILQFIESCGPKHTPPPAASPIAYFDMFFTHALLDMFVKQTNKYAKHYFEQENKSTHYTSKWKNITLEELKGFLACILNMGINRRPTLVSYWSTSKSQNFPWFQEMFTRTRFQLILKFFHISDTRNRPKPGMPGYDPCANIQSLIDHANNIFSHHYIPHEQLSIDESSVRTKNQTQRTVKYWKKLCFNVFSRMVLNAYIIYKENVSPTTKPKTRLNFIISIIHDLGEEWLLQKNGHEQPSEDRDSSLVKLPGKRERDCIVCSKRKKSSETKRRRSRTICNKCTKGVHEICFLKHKCP